MDVYFFRLGIFFQSIFDVNSQVTWNTKLVTCIVYDEINQYQTNYLVFPFSLWILDIWISKYTY